MLHASFNRLLWAVHTKHTRTHIQNAHQWHAISHARVYFSLSSPSFLHTRFDGLLCKTLLWHYLIHYGLRLRYVLLYIATLTLSTSAGKSNTVSSPVSPFPIFEAVRFVKIRLDKKNLCQKKKLRGERFTDTPLCFESIHLDGERLVICSDRERERERDRDTQVNIVDLCAVRSTRSVNASDCLIVRAVATRDIRRA